MSEENKKLNRVEEKLKELSKCELFLDNIFIKDKTARQILVSAYNKLERQQKEIEEKNVAINKMSKDISRQLKEIEEKSTIIMAGAEKVKRLECQIEELLNVLNKEEKINYIKPIDIKVHNYISEDKIREKIEHYNNELEHIKNGEEFENEKPMYYWGKVALENLLEEN